MIYKLLEPNHPLVTTKLPKFVDSEQDLSRAQLIENLLETMRHYGGIGLSANQVGLPFRVFVFGDNDNYVPCFNPEIIKESDDKCPMSEGCLTYPGLFVKIYRPDRASIQFEDEKGEVHTDELKGLPCRIFQHEMDHMNGIDFTKRATVLQLDMAKRKLKKARRKLKRMHEQDSLSRAS